MYGCMDVDMITLESILVDGCLYDQGRFMNDCLGRCIRVHECFGRCNCSQPLLYLTYMNESMNGSIDSIL